MNEIELKVYWTNQDFIDGTLTVEIMENNKYFTPSIEDIRVGYELSHKLDKAKLGTGSYSLLVSDGNIENILKNISNFEVPYLTKEQIEAEGYSLTQMNKGKYIKYFGGDLHVYDHNGDTFYLGECKDINTFRLITKLLGVEK